MEADQNGVKLKNSLIHFDNVAEEQQLKQKRRISPSLLDSGRNSPLSGTFISDLEETYTRFMADDREMTVLLAEIDEIIQSSFLIPKKRLTQDMPIHQTPPKETEQLPPKHPSTYPPYNPVVQSESDDQSSEYYYESVAEDLEEDAEDSYSLDLEQRASLQPSDRLNQESSVAYSDDFVSYNETQSIAEDSVRDSLEDIPETQREQSPEPHSMKPSITSIEALNIAVAVPPRDQVQKSSFDSKRTHETNHIIELPSSRLLSPAPDKVNTSERLNTASDQESFNEMTTDRVRLQTPHLRPGTALRAGQIETDSSDDEFQVFRTLKKSGSRLISLRDKTPERRRRLRKPHKLHAQSYRALSYQKSIDFQKLTIPSEKHKQLLLEMSHAKPNSPRSSPVFDVQKNVAKVASNRSEDTVALEFRPFKTNLTSDGALGNVDTATGARGKLDPLQSFGTSPQNCSRDNAKIWNTFDTPQTDISPPKLSAPVGKQRLFSIRKIPKSQHSKTPEFFEKDAINIGLPELSQKQSTRKRRKSPQTKEKSKESKRRWDPTSSHSKEYQKTLFKRMKIPVTYSESALIQKPRRYVSRSRVGTSLRQTREEDITERNGERVPKMLVQTIGIDQGCQTALKGIRSVTPKPPQASPVVFSNRMKIRSQSVESRGTRRTKVGLTPFEIIADFNRSQLNKNEYNRPNSQSQNLSWTNRDQMQVSLMKEYVKELEKLKIAETSLPSHVLKAYVTQDPVFKKYSKGVDKKEIKKEISEVMPSSDSVPKIQLIRDMSCPDVMEKAVIRVKKQRKRQAQKQKSIDGTIEQIKSEIDNIRRKW